MMIGISVLIIAGCSESTPKQSALLAVLDQLSDKQIVAKGEAKDGIVLFMTDGSSLHTGLVFDQSYSSYCGGGSLPLNENPEVSYLYSDCSSDNSKKKTGYTPIFTGIINNDAIAGLELQYSVGKKKYTEKAEILKTKEGNRVWFLKPEGKTKYHVTLDSMTGYTDDGKVVYKK